jgi:hypothetical protein
MRLTPLPVSRNDKAPITEALTCIPGRNSLQVVGPAESVYWYSTSTSKPRQTDSARDGLRGRGSLSDPPASLELKLSPGGKRTEGQNVTGLPKKA